MADVKLLSYHSKCCVMSLTTTYRPFIDLVSPKLGVAIGGNGYAAKSCDEIGRLAASLLITGKWTDDLPHDVFQLSADKPITHFVKKLA
jgi:sarcosine oxidase/L-pipecolate oxidase